MTLPFSVDPLLLASGGYQISCSVRLRSAASAYLGRTFGTPTSQNIWTYSVWVKRGNLTAVNNIGLSVTGQNNQLYFNNDSTLNLYNNVTQVFTTTQVFRDPSAWYHIVLAFSGGAASNKVRLYVNGSEVTSFTTDNRATTTTSTVNTAIAHGIGLYLQTPSNFLDGYLAEINFVDGQQLAASSFGFTDSNGIWQPKAYTGTYGNNGFYLKFTDNSAATATTLGKDYSGNGNNWTPNNISVTAGVTYDSMTDSPTNSAGASNYPVLNPLSGSTQSVWAISNANLTYAVGNSTTWASARSNVLISSGKWYWEVTPANTQNCLMGICLDSVPFQTSPAQSGVIGYNNDGTKSVNGTTTAYGTAWAASDIIGMAFDATTGTLVVYKNNTSLGTLASGITGSLGYYPCWFGGNNNAQGSVNFGQRPFSYTPPTGYSALNTYNLPAATINNGATVMAASTYTGNGTSQSIVNSGNNAAATLFKPDFVWLKGRSVAYVNGLFDSVRGAGKNLNSASTAAEGSNDVDGYLSAFNSNGFSLSAGSNSSLTWNQNAATYIGWQWQAGQGTTSSNTSGSITSTVSVNVSAGFSVATYTGNNSSGSTFGHGLGVTPSFVIIKSRSSATRWLVKAPSITGTNVLALNETSAAASGLNGYIGTLSSSNVQISGINTNSDINASGATYVAYCWSEVAGYSKFGSYTGNGSTDGPFIYCGFRPRFFMVKRTDSTGGWNMIDTSMAPYNLAQPLLQANTSAAEVQASEVDILSNGIKYRGASTNVLYDHNVSGANYIYAAFAENPFTIARAR